MVQGWIAAFVMVALIASQAAIEPIHTRLSDEQSTLSALAHPALPAARLKHRSGDLRRDARRPMPRLHAVVPAPFALERVDARIAGASTPITIASSDCCRRSTRSRAPPQT